MDADECAGRAADPSDVAPLRQTAAHAWAAGGVVGPASVLLERIAAEKAGSMAEKKIRKPKACRRLRQMRCRLRRVGAHKVRRCLQRHHDRAFRYGIKKSEYVPNGTPVINPQNLKDRESSRPHLHRLGLTPCSGCRPSKWS